MEKKLIDMNTKDRNYFEKCLKKIEKIDYALIKNFERLIKLDKETVRRLKKELKAVQRQLKIIANR